MKIELSNKFEWRPMHKTICLVCTSLITTQCHRNK